MLMMIIYSLIQQKNMYLIYRNIWVRIKHYIVLRII